ncbi:GntP family permease [Treponema socranskii subsp. buccale]|uniref:GntP family permease n=1 Tax=Treponema socranskii TaxID=53419 RepID=UPI0020A25E7A|nr:GntP family permease [Treponema socranskii]UTD03179.1 GntP family permease [Treponema socranskii subsp. buccale]
MGDISGAQMLLGLGIGLLVLILLILKTKVHVFIALIIASCIIGLAGGMAPTAIAGTITKGFGGTLGGIGIIIGLGVMMGQIFEASGAAERMARVFLKLFGKGREEFAMAVTGYVVSIAIFCDSGFVILSPLARALSKETKKSMVSLSVALAGGLVITHSLVPPTPGPLGVAGTFGIDVGNFLLLGLVVSIPMTLAVMFYGKWLGKKIYQIPGDKEGEWQRPPYQKPQYDTNGGANAKKLPNAFVSFMPIVLPVVLILLNTVLSALKATGPIATFFFVVGTPIFAVLIGTLLAIFTLTRGQSRESVINTLEASIKSAGIIILVTGGGGALGQVIKDAGVGNYIAQGIAATHIPVILLPFIIATLVRFVQGSGTVAMITAAGITAPIVAASGGNMVLGALAATVGSLFFSYFNDSFYWVVNRLSGITDTKEQIRVWSISTTIAWAVGFAALLILDIFM